MHFHLRLLCRRFNVICSARCLGFGDDWLIRISDNEPNFVTTRKKFKGRIVTNTVIGIYRVYEFSIIFS